MARRTRSAELDAALQLDSEHAQATQFRKRYDLLPGSPFSIIFYSAFHSPFIVCGLVQSSTYPQFYSNTAEHESSINRRLPELPYSHPSSDRPPSYHSDCSQNGTGNLITHCPPSSLIAVYGIKGPCFLNEVDHFDLIRGMSVDYMHGVLMGVTKALMNLWFKSDRKNPYYCGHHLPEIDSILQTITPPMDIHRTPRGITDHMQHWKASEFRSWLLFYSLPIMQWYLPNVYFENYSLLVTGIHLLLGESITEDNISKAEDDLRQFVEGFQTLYGSKLVSLNVHNLLHYAQTVRELGPLFGHSCFFFEDINGQLLKLIHGTQAVEEQEEKSKPDGTYNTMKKPHMEALMARVDFLPERLMLYQRMMKNGEMVHSRLYTRPYRHNSYTITYTLPDEDTGFGEVLYFVQALTRTCGCLTQTCQCGQVTARHFALVQCLEPAVPSPDDSENASSLFSVPHIHKCKKTEEFKAVKLNEVVGKVVSLFLNGNSYLATFPNRMEKD
uniref:Uncharacterized protein n=1 Tax=Branchiostoma floridae TaxID=7739 RepID=C3ZNH1_BRAFL|eukprot:XP_002589913.1 hypothetical protein BRAFLDRAFT_81959 [Branchiostoma floridae]